MNENDYKGPAPVMLKTRPRGSMIRIETAARPLNARFIEILRPTGKEQFGFAIVEGTGRYRRDRLRVSCGGDTVVVEFSKDGVDGQVRRMRPQEFDQLQEIDRQLAELRLRRHELVHDAFRRAHTVTVRELRELAETNLPRAALMGRGLQETTT